MTVGGLLKLDGFTALNLSDENREIKGVYVGDLLSWVMGNAESGNAWITIMSNVNILAVASLADVSCIIISEGVALEEDIIATAKEKEINVISSNLTTYETAVKLGSVL